MRSLLIALLILPVMVLLGAEAPPPKRYAVRGSVAGVLDGTDPRFPGVVGLLVSCEPRAAASGPEASGVILLRGHPAQKTIGRFDSVDCTVVEVGRQAYVSRMGMHIDAAVVDFIAGATVILQPTSHATVVAAKPAPSWPPTPAAAPPATLTQPSPGQPSPAVAAGPRPAAAHPSISFEAVPAGSNSRQDSQWESGYGSYQHTFTSGSTVEVRLRNIGRKTASVRVITVFFARPPAGGKRVVCSLDDRKFSIDPSRDASFVTESQPVADQDDNYAALGQRYQKGLRFEGWAVALIDNVSGSLIKTTGSNSGVEGAIATTDALADIVSVYHRAK